MVHSFQNLMQIPGSLTTTDYHLNPFSLCSPAFATSYTAAFHNSEYSDLGMIGNLFHNKFPFQLDQSSSLQYLRNDKLEIQEVMEFPEHRTFLQLLEEHSNNELEELHSSDPAYLRLPVALEEPQNQRVLHHEITSHQPGLQLLNLSSKVSMLLEGQPEGLGITADSEVSPALSNNIIMQSESKVCDPATTTNPNECAYQASGQSLSASYNSEKSQKEGLASTNLPFSSGQSQSSYGTQKQKSKRKRKRSSKNSEEVESQRQTHIAVERNRRKQMNEHLSILRSMMPGSYVPRGDQASIVGGAIEFVRELEQLLEYLEAQKRRKIYSRTFSFNPCPLLGDAFPQVHHQQVDSHDQSFFMSTSVPPDSKYVHDNFYEPVKEIYAESKSQIAEVEVQITGNNALMKILSPKVSGQLLKTIAALENLGMTIMHTNITTVEQTVLYSFNVKLEVGCQLGTAEEIAAAVQQIFENMIHCKSV